MREQLLKGLLLFRLPIHSSVSPPFDGLIIAHIIVLVNMISTFFCAKNKKVRSGTKE